MNAVNARLLYRDGRVFCEAYPVKRGTWQVKIDNEKGGWIGDEYRTGIWVFTLAGERDGTLTYVEGE